MSEYFVIKREKCWHAPATFVVILVYQDNGTMPSTKTLECTICGRKGYTETHTNADEWLIERLAQLRWDGFREGADDCDEKFEASLDNPKFAQ